MKRFLILTACLVAIFLAVARSVGAVSLKEGQGRFGINIAIELDEQVSLILDDEFRLGDEQDEYYFHSEIGVKYRVFKWLDVDVFFRFIGDRNGSWQFEYRPHTDATFKHSWTHFGISNRNRLEYRFRGDDTSYGRYRNKLKLFFPFKVRTYPFKPYIADEIFIDLNEGRFEQNRIFTGLDFMFHKYVGLNIYYFWEYAKLYPGTQRTHVGGLKVKLKF